MNAALRTTLTAAALCLFAAAPASSAVVVERVVTVERNIHRLPLVHRPNRIGHVYGNNVRRVYHRRVLVNYGRYPAPVMRYFYVP